MHISVKSKSMTDAKQDCRVGVMAPRPKRLDAPEALCQPPAGGVAAAFRSSGEAWLNEAIEAVTG